MLVWGRRASKNSPSVVNKFVVARTKSISLHDPIVITGSVLFFAVEISTRPFWADVWSEDWLLTTDYFLSQSW